MLDCSKCIKKCKAECCCCVPIRVKDFKKHASRIQKPIVDFGSEMEATVIYDNGKEGKVRVVLPITKDMSCCFLKEDNSCAIYEDRPLLCKKFGDESHSFLTCKFQDKNGKLRSVEEREKLEKKLKESTVGKMLYFASVAFGKTDEDIDGRLPKDR